MLREAVVWGQAQLAEGQERVQAGWGVQAQPLRRSVHSRYWSYCLQLTVGTQHNGKSLYRSLYAPTVVTDPYTLVPSTCKSCTTSHCQKQAAVRKPHTSQIQPHLKVAEPAAAGASGTSMNA